MLMACHRRFFEGDRPAFSRILRAIAVISFRYNVICNLPTHEQERLYNDIAWKVTDGIHATDRQIVTALHELYPEDQQFKAAFADKELQTTNSRNKKVVRYILFEIERQRSGQDFSLESAIYSIEHILPESPSEHWASIDETKQERLIYRLGNMTSLESSYNRDIGNKEYAFKRTVYEKSGFQITRAIAEHYDMWDEKKVEARQKQLATVASSIWRLDF